jgi:ATP-dependent Lhr-like helicase
MSRLQALAPGLRRVGLSATVSDPDAYRSWLAPDADMELVDLVIRAIPAPSPTCRSSSPNKIPWSGHSGRHAAREVMELIEQHKTTLVFCNTRSLAELIFQDLWAVNDQALPIGIHHGSLAVEARRKVEAAMADGQAARRWSPPPASTSASTGATSTSSSRWARPRAARACCSGSAAPTTGSTSRARA